MSDTIEKVALKDCPFCGSSDVEVRESITDAMVACNNCGSRTGFVYLGANDASNATKIRECIGIWNQRAAISAYEQSQAEERAAIERLGQELELTHAQVLRCALRHYQTDHEKLKAGETCTWSGDAQRAADFAPPGAEATPLLEQGRK